eukprot:gene791-1535_t
MQLEEEFLCPWDFVRDTERPFFVQEAIIQSYRDDNHNDNDDNHRRMFHLSVPDPVLWGSARTPIANYTPYTPVVERAVNEIIWKLLAHPMRTTRLDHLLDPYS